jgi:hypothetical protein
MTSLRESARRLKERLYVSLTPSVKSTDTSSMAKSFTKGLAESIYFSNPRYKELVRNEYQAQFNDVRQIDKGRPAPEPQQLSGSVQEETNPYIRAMARGGYVPPSWRDGPTTDHPIAYERISAGYGKWKYNKNDIKNVVSGILNVMHKGVYHGEAFDCIALSGSSGVWLGAILQQDMPDNIAVLLVRKESEKSHGSLVEGDPSKVCTRALFIDDFTCTHETERRVTRALQQYGVKVVGSLLYGQWVGF